MSMIYCFIRSRVYIEQYIIHLIEKKINMKPYNEVLGM
jgi:hypothetical protein